MPGLLAPISVDRRDRARCSRESSSGAWTGLASTLPLPALPGARDLERNQVQALRVRDQRIALGISATRSDTASNYHAKLRHHFDQRACRYWRAGQPLSDLFLTTTNPLVGGWFRNPNQMV